MHIGRQRCLSRVKARHLVRDQGRNVPGLPTAIDTSRQRRDTRSRLDNVVIGLQPIIRPARGKADAVNVNKLRT